MKKTFLFAAVTALCLAFSGCSVFETDTEALMHPPLLSEEQEKLNAALTEVAGENFTLKYPKTGEMNSAFIFEDLDNDGEDEAMAFYSSVDESTRINILKKSGDGWISVYEAAGFSGEMESIDFIQMKNGAPVLFVKWPGEIGIYSFENDRLETVYSAACDGTDIVDMNADGFSEIVVFKGTAMSRSFLSVIYHDGNEVVSTEEISVHAEYDSIISAKVGDFGNGKYAYFVDSFVYEEVFLTEMFVLEEGEVERFTVADFVVYEDENEKEPEAESGTIIIIGGNLGKRGIFLRNTGVYCLDTNGDGVMEFPVEVREDYATEASDELYYIQYMQLVDEEAKVAWNGIANTQDGYIFAVPAAWNERATLSFNSLDNEMVFIDKETSRVIFKICMSEKSDYQDKFEDYVLVAEDETRNFYVKSFVEPEDNFYLDPELYEKCFIFI